MQRVSEGINKADSKRFSRLQEELENDYTKGVDHYPKSVVKAYHLLNDFKSTAGRTVVSDGQDISFLQKESNKKKR